MDSPQCPRRPIWLHSCLSTHPRLHQRSPPPHLQCIARSGSMSHRCTRTLRRSAGHSLLTHRLPSPLLPALHLLQTPRCSTEGRHPKHSPLGSKHWCHSSAQTHKPHPFLLQQGHSRHWTKTRHDRSTHETSRRPSNPTRTVSCPPSTSSR